MKNPLTAQTAMAIAARITENGLTAKKVCEVADITVETFRLYKKGRTGMTLETCALLNTAVDELSGLAFDKQQNEGEENE